MNTSSHSIQSAPGPPKQAMISGRFSARRANTTFVTQEEIKTTEEIIAERIEEINKYIDKLEPKIKLIIEHNQAQLLIAYRNHFGNIKNQIQRFKDQTLAQIKNQANVLVKMQKMETQLILFRDQSLRLHSLVVEKDSLIEELQIKLSELESQRLFMNTKVKELMKINKLATINYQYHQSPLVQNQNTSGNQPAFKKTKMSLGINSFKQSTRKDNKVHCKTLATSLWDDFKEVERPSTRQFINKNLFSRTQTKFNEKNNDLITSTFQQKFSHFETTQLTDIIQTAEQVFSKINSLQESKCANSVCDQERSSMNKRSNSYCYNSRTGSQLRNRTSLSSQKDRAKREGLVKEQQLRGYFQKCVETVKHDIVKRKKNKTNYMETGKSIGKEDFRRDDVLRLLQIVFANQKVRQVLECHLVGTRPDPLKY